jgi:hypothetical protein
LGNYREGNDPWFWPEQAPKESLELSFHN